MKSKKISLSCFGDKRFVSGDGIHTLAYFHKELRKQIHTDNHKFSQIIIKKKRL